jgi:hypothetical protein
MSREILQYHFTMPDESSELEKPSQPPPEPAVQADTEQKHRKLDNEEFKAKLEMTKAFCDTAKGCVQISSAGLALPLFFQEAMLGKVRGENGLLGSCPWELIASWALFLVAIACGLLYQWLSMRRLWDQYHMGNRTPENMHEPGYRVTPGVVKIDKLNLSWIWLGMMGAFYLGAVFFAIYAGTVIVAGKVGPQPNPQHTGPPATSVVGPPRNP